MSTVSPPSRFADRAETAVAALVLPRRAAVVSCALFAAALVSAINLLARPVAAVDVDRYEALAPKRDAVWTFALVGGVSAAVVYVAVGIAVCMLAPRRGAAWATVGALLTTAGGILFCAGFFAWGAVSWYATTDAVPAEAGRAMFAFVQAEDGRAFGPQIAGFGLALLGILALAVALWRARTVPRGLAVAMPLALFAVVGAGTGVVYDVLHALFMATLAGVAFSLWRATRTSGR